MQCKQSVLCFVSDMCSQCLVMMMVVALVRSIPEREYCSADYGLLPLTVGDYNYTLLRPELLVPFLFKYKNPTYVNSCTTFCGKEKELKSVN